MSLFVLAPQAPEPPTQWGPLLTIVIVSLLASAILGYIGWRKRND